MTSKFQDDGHGVISGRKVLPPVECTHGICPAPMYQRPPVLIYYTFALVFVFVVVYEFSLIS